MAGCQFFAAGGSLLDERVLAAAGDVHPLASCLWIDEGRLVLEGDYFGHSTACYNTSWHHFAGGEQAQTNKAEFQWPLGDIVTTLARAGMRIERLEQFPAEQGWRFGDQAEQVRRLPGLFLLVTSAGDKVKGDKMIGH